MRQPFRHTEHMLFDPASFPLVAGIAIAVVIAIIVLIVVLSSIKVAKPDEAIIVTSRQRTPKERA